MHVIRPDDQIDAVVYGRRSFIVTIPFSRRNSTLRPFSAISRKFKWHRTLNEQTTLLMTISISGSGSVSWSFVSSTTASVVVAVVVGGCGGGDDVFEVSTVELDPIEFLVLDACLISLVCIVVLLLLLLVGLKFELLLSVIDAIPFRWIPSLWLLISSVLIVDAIDALVGVVAAVVNVVRFWVEIDVGANVLAAAMI